VTVFWIIPPILPSLTFHPLSLKLKGYGYAIIGSVGPTDFYRKAVGAVEIPDLTPGIWKNWLHGIKW
jgi:hypothetical protein